MPETKPNGRRMATQLYIGISYNANKHKHNAVQPSEWCASAIDMGEQLKICQQLVVVNYNS